MKSCRVLQDHFDDDRDKTVFHNTTPDLQDQDQEQDQFVFVSDRSCLDCLFTFDRRSLASSREIVENLGEEGRGSLPRTPLGEFTALTQTDMQWSNCGERGGTAFPFRFWRGDAVPLAFTTTVGGRGGTWRTPRPLHHQLKSKYGHYFFLLGSLKFCYTLVIQY